MQGFPEFTHEDYQLMNVPLAREDVPADALATLAAWISKERLLVDDRENVGGIDFSRMDAKVMAPLPHIFASFYARLPYKSKDGYYPQWNGFYMLLYQDGEEGWKLERIQRNFSWTQLDSVYSARSKAVEEIKKRIGNDLEDHEA